MTNRQVMEKNMASMKLFLAATVLVLVCLLGFIGGFINLLAAEICVAFLVILTVALWVVIRLHHPQKIAMNEEPSKEAPSVPKKPDEILPPEKARQWLDDFLVEQQKDV